MCTFCYTVLRSLFATQGGDAGAISSSLPLHKGGGSRVTVYIVYTCTQNCSVRGDYFFKKETMKALDLRMGI